MKRLVITFIALLISMCCISQTGYGYATKKIEKNEKSMKKGKEFPFFEESYVATIDGVTKEYLFKMTILEEVRLIEYIDEQKFSHTYIQIYFFNEETKKFRLLDKFAVMMPRYDIDAVMDLARLYLINDIVQIKY